MPDIAPCRAMAQKASQFDVWGAAITTALRTSGTPPSTCPCSHPEEKPRELSQKHKQQPLVAPRAAGKRRSSSNGIQRSAQIEVALESQQQCATDYAGRRGGKPVTLALLLPHVRAQLVESQPRAILAAGSSDDAWSAISLAERLAGRAAPDAVAAGFRAGRRASPWTNLVVHPAFQHRVSGLPEIKLWVKLTAETFDIETGFCAAESSAAESRH